MKFNELQKDAILEVCNIGMSKAAKQLSTLLNCPIVISSPRLQLMHDITEAQDALENSSERIHLIHQTLSNDLRGDAIMVFNQDYANFLLKNIVGGTHPLGSEEMMSCKQEALLEVGNIIISSAVTAIGNMLTLKMLLTVPDHHENSIDQLIHEKTIPVLKDCPDIIVLSTHLSTQETTFSGKLAFFLPPESIDALLVAVNHFLSI